jgi:hypothetical protein
LVFLAASKDTDMVVDVINSEAPSASKTLFRMITFSYPQLSDDITISAQRA